MDDLEAKQEELYEELLPGIWKLSKELGLDIQTTLTLVSLHYQEKWRRELSRAQRDYKKVEITLEEYRKRVSERVGEEAEAKMFRAALDE